MTTTPETPTVELAKIHDHPANPRIDAVADDATVESIRSVGVLEPLLVAPRVGADGEWTLIDGHRRKNGAIRAGLSEVPIHPRYDLVTEGQQIEAMIITGLQKALLSPVEEAAGYEQLELLGHDEASIAAATGFSVRRVKDRLKLNQLPAEARTKVHAGDATLTDLADLDEFTDDADATAELVDALGTPNFRSAVYSLRAQRERAARHAERIAEFEAAGAKPWSPDEGEAVSWSRTEVCPLTWFRSTEHRDADTHPECLGYYHAGAGSYSDPLLVCTDAAAHTEPQTGDENTAARDEQQAKHAREQAARDERAARRSAAAAARLEWLVAHYAGMLPTKSHQPLAAATKALLPLVFTDDDRPAVDDALLVRALGGPVDDRSYATLHRIRGEHAAALSDATATKVLGALAALLAALTAEQLDTEPGFLSESIDARRVLDLWDWLKGAGYQLSDVDREVRAELEVRHTALTDEDAADAADKVA